MGGSESGEDYSQFRRVPSFSFSMQIKALCAFLSGNNSLTVYFVTQELFLHSAETLLPFCRNLPADCIYWRKYWRSEQDVGQGIS